MTKELEFAAAVQCVVRGNLTNLEKLVYIDHLASIATGQEWDAQGLNAPLGVSAIQAKDMIEDITPEGPPDKPESAPVGIRQYFALWQKFFKEIAGINFDFSAKEAKSMKLLSEKLTLKELELLVLWLKHKWKNPEKMTPSILYSSLNYYKSKILPAAKKGVGKSGTKEFSWGE